MMQSVKVKPVKYIDLKGILKDTDSKILRSLPGFAISIIALIIREKQINEIIGKYEGYEGVDFLPKIIEEFGFKIEAEGLENLPENGKCFFVANHPFGLADGLTLTSIVGKKYGRLNAIGNEVFNFIPNLRPLVAYVNVFGRSPKEYFQALENLYRSDMPITHFPAGLVSRKHDGKIQDQIWQKSFITKAVSCQRDIVPFYFYGRNSRLFYTIFRVRKFFKIEANIELMLLPHEIFRKKGKTIKVKIGKPISYTKFDKSMSHVEWAEKVRQYVYKMGETPGSNPEF